jgi:hypothetical protein
MAYVIVDKDGCYLDDASGFGTQRILRLFQKIEHAEEQIDIYFKDQGYKTRYLKTHSEKSVTNEPE